MAPVFSGALHHRISENYIVDKMAESRENTPRSLIGKKLEVECNDSVVREGFLYTNDPQTNILVLVNRIVLCQETASITAEDGCKLSLSYPANQENKNTNNVAVTDIKSSQKLKFEFIMRDAYESVKDIHKDSDDQIWASIQETLFRMIERKENCTPINSPDTKEKLEVITEKLQKHHLPYKVDKFSIELFHGLVKIEPPYNKNSCFSRNPVVLDKIRNLIETDSKDVEMT